MDEELLETVTATGAAGEQRADTDGAQVDREQRDNHDDRRDGDTDEQHQAQCDAPVLQKR